MSGSHANRNEANERSLWIALVPTAGFMVAEIVGGVLTNSLALISDAAHMATDVFGLALAIAAIRIGRRAADRRHTYGYERLEILAAALNALILFAVAGYIVYEAWKRLTEPPAVNSTAMLAIAVVGLVVNLFSLRVLSAGKDESLNVKGAYLEVWSDFVGSVGVIAAAVVIYLTGIAWVDSLVAVLIGLWVVPRTWALLKESINTLLEGVPDGVDLAAIAEGLKAMEGVADVHDLHVWAITGGRICLTAHLVVPDGGSDALLKKARTMLHDGFDIAHVTLQIETKPCEDAGVHSFL